MLIGQGQSCVNGKCQMRIDDNNLSFVPNVTSQATLF
jgi:hypothetical protein